MKFASKEIFHYVLGYFQSSYHTPPPSPSLRIWTHCMSCVEIRVDVPMKEDVVSCRSRRGLRPPYSMASRNIMAFSMPCLPRWSSRDSCLPATTFVPVTPISSSVHFIMNSLHFSPHLHFEFHYLRVYPSYRFTRHNIV